MKSNLAIKTTEEMVTPVIATLEVTHNNLKYERRTKLVRPIPHTPEIVQFEAVEKMRGQIFVRWNRVRFARFYTVFLSDNINDPCAWTEFASVTTSRITIAGLDSTKRYWIKVNAINTSGASNDSAQVSVITQ